MRQFEYVFESKGFLILQLYYRSQTMLRFSVIAIFKINHVMSVSLKFEPHIKAYLSISLDIITVLAPSIPRFKGLGMRNLH